MSFLKEYTMLGELGSGGFAKVYKVRHDKLGYIRAIRVLNETIVDEKSKTYQKFLRECKVLLRLGNGSNRNIVHIYQPRLLDSHALVEMDYVDGEDLSHYLADNGNFVHTQDVLRMVEDISNALAYCHEDIYRFCMDRETDNLQDDPADGSKVLIDDAKRKELIDNYKVIHNDMHSGNIMRREDGSYVLLDFGLAITGGDDVRNSSRHEGGAVEFKPPEKWDDDTVLTEQSDIYSFGVVMYEYLAGRVPFPFDKRVSNKTEALYMLSVAHKKEVPPSISELRKSYYETKNPGCKYDKDYPEWLEEMIMKCLAKNPQDRFKNGKELYAFVRSHSVSSDSLLVGRVQELEQENESLRNNIKTISAGVSFSGNADSTALKQQVEELSAQLSKKEECIANLDRKNSQLNGKIEKNAIEKSDLEAKMSKLQQTNVSLTDDIAKREKENKQLEDTIVNLKSQGGKTKPLPIVLIVLFVISTLVFGFLWLNNGDDNEDLVNTLESEKEDLSDKLASTEAMLDNLQKENGILNDSLMSKDKAIVRLKDLLNENGTSEDLIAMQEEKARLESEIEKHETDLANAQKKIKELETDKSSLKKKNTELTTSNSKLKKENDDLKKNKGDLTNAQKKIDELEKEKNALTGHVSSLNGQLTAEKKKTTDLTASNSNLKKENDDLKKSNGDMANVQKRITELESDKAALSGQVSSLNGQLSAEKKKTTDLTASNSKLKKENDELKKSGSTSNTTNIELKNAQNRIQVLEREKSEAQTKAKQYEDELLKCINDKNKK